MTKDSFSNKAEAFEAFDDTPLSPAHGDAIGAVIARRFSRRDLLNGSIGVYSLNDKWDLSLWGQNLTDEYYTQQVTSNANVVLRFAGRPRTYGITLSYRY